jgi:hypothetical protein
VWRYSESIIIYASLCRSTLLVCMGNDLFRISAPRRRQLKLIMMAPPPGPQSKAYVLVYGFRKLIIVRLVKSSYFTYN